MLASEAVSFFGHSHVDYVHMFELGHAEIDTMHILDCGGAFSDFAKEMELKHHRVVVVDPIFSQSQESLKQKIDVLEKNFLNYVKNHASEIVWQQGITPEWEAARRRDIAEKFIRDYPAGLKEGRYIPESLPNLGFREDAFDLALCSHFLFTYTRELPLAFHISAILEMLRVSEEVRIFPLVDYQGQLSSHLGPVLQELSTHGYETEIKQVSYGLQKGGNAMLVIDKEVCQVKAHQDSNIRST